jgi:hypothetical protein
MTSLVGRVYVAASLVVCVLALTAGSAEKSKPGAKSKGDEALIAADPAAGEKYDEKASSLIRVRRFAGIGERFQIKTPIYRSSSIAVPEVPPQDWAEVSLTYDVIPDWIDTLSMKFFVLTQKEEGGKKLFSLYKTTVNYVDVERGRNRTGSVYLTPAALKRYGKVVAIGVEVLHEGKIVGEMSEVEVPGLPKMGWWRQESVSDPAKVTPREGYLLNRSQSPFALINYDDHPVIRQ